MRDADVISREKAGEMNVGVLIADRSLKNSILEK